MMGRYPCDTLYGWLLWELMHVSEADDTYMTQCQTRIRWLLCVIGWQDAGDGLRDET